MWMNLLKENFQSSDYKMTLKRFIWIVVQSWFKILIIQKLDLIVFLLVELFLIFLINFLKFLNNI